MQYFSRFPKVVYPYKGKIVGEKTDKIEYIECSDIMLRFVVSSKILLNPLVRHDYRWKDGDRPDKIAKAYYGDADLAWLVMLSAALYDWYGDLPKTEDAFTNYITSTYGSFEQARNLIHHYEDDEGFIIDQETYEEFGGVIVSFLDFETQENDEKRNIRLISNTFTKAVKEDFERQIRQVVDARKISGVN